MADMSDIPTVWVFNAARSNFPGAVFTSKQRAEAWISKHGLTGTLTRYPLDLGVFEFHPGTADDADLGRSEFADVGIRHFRSVERRSTS